jgi:hypothetical protein
MGSIIDLSLEQQIASQCNESITPHYALVSTSICCYFAKDLNVNFAHFSSVQSIPAWKVGRLVVCIRHWLRSSAWARWL